MARRILRSLFLAALLVSVSSTAQAQGDSIATTLSPGTPVRFRQDGRWIKATALGSAGDTVSIAVQQGDSMVTFHRPFSSFENLQYSGGKQVNVGKGALYGGLAGLVGGAVAVIVAEVTANSMGEGWEPARGPAETMGISIAFGAALGMITSVMKPEDRWRAVQAFPVQPQVSASPKGVAAGVSISFQVKP